ncbi:RNA polymerase sigma factor [Lentzea sp. CA-135723]|uniref:RNA polymerase sigma factor n=1 Tax=Lentzea sp. CA-135723 TaxID=3239950 RepID=UPI003D91AB43
MLKQHQPPKPEAAVPDDASADHLLTYSGRGKSSMLFRLVEELRYVPSRTTIVVDYAAWLCAQYDLPTTDEPSPAEDFTAFKRAVRDPLVRVVVKQVLGCRRAQAEEAVDAAITIVWQRASQNDEISNPRAYVIRVAIRLVLKAVQAERRLRSSDNVADAEDVNSAQSLQAAELRADLKRAMASMPPRMRAILTQHLLGNSYQEIAAFFKISPGTVAAQLNKARARLRLALHGWEQR